MPDRNRHTSAKSNPAPEEESGGLTVGRLARAIFTQQVKVRLSDKGLKVVLENPQDVRGPAPNPVVTDEAVRAQLMSRDLTALLDAAPGSRKVLRHLAAIEHDLEHKDSGALFLFGVDPQTLRVALRQLDGLIVGPLSLGMTVLRGRILDAIDAQEIRERARALREPLSSFLVEEKLQVIDARVTDFDQANAAWVPTLPPARDNEPPLLEQIPNRPDPER